MYAFPSQIAAVLEGIFAEEASLVNLLSYVGDHYEHCFHDCASLMALKVVIGDSDQWRSHAFKYICGSVPAEAVIEFASVYKS